MGQGFWQFASDAWINVEYGSNNLHICHVKQNSASLIFPGIYLSKLKQMKVMGFFFLLFFPLLFSPKSDQIQKLFLFEI